MLCPSNDSGRALAASLRTGGIEAKFMEGDLNLACGGAAEQSKDTQDGSPECQSGHTGRATEPGRNGEARTKRRRSNPLTPIAQDPSP